MDVTVLRWGSEWGCWFNFIVISITLLQVLVSLALLSTAIYCYVHGYQTSSPATQLLGAFILGVFFWQTAFMGHDAGHTGITHNRFYDTIFGVVVGPLLTGISIGKRYCIKNVQGKQKTNSLYGTWRWPHRNHAQPILWQNTLFAHK